MNMKPPKDNQIQFIVFGPGFGESILIHLGSKHWVIIDSCNNYDGKPVALSYLYDIGVDVKNDVKLIAVTHWHKDHIVGIDEILLECESAKFAIPKVLEEEQYKAYLIVNKLMSVDTNNFKQNVLINCINILNRRKLSPIYLGENVIMWERDAVNFSHNKKIKLVALSPSNFRYSKFLKDIEKHKYLNTSSTRTEDSNLFSAAMQVSIGDEYHMLLGADLMYLQRQNCGWKNIIENQKEKSDTTNIYKIYKVAHHGSVRSNQIEIWDNLLSKNLISIVTPKSNNKLPQKKGIELIVENSNRSYITNSEKINSKYIKPEKSVNFTRAVRAIDCFIKISIDVKNNYYQTKTVKSTCAGELV